MKESDRSLSCDVVKEFFAEQKGELQDLIWQMVLFFRTHRELLGTDSYRRLYREVLELWCNWVDGTQGLLHNEDELADIELLADLFIEQSLLPSISLTQEQMDSFLELRQRVWRSL